MRLGGPFSTPIGGPGSTPIYTHLWPLCRDRTPGGLARPCRNADGNRPLRRFEPGDECRAGITDASHPCCRRSCLRSAQWSGGVPRSGNRQMSSRSLSACQPASHRRNQPVQRSDSGGAGQFARHQNQVTIADRAHLKSLRCASASGTTVLIVGFPAKKGQIHARSDEAVSNCGRESTDGTGKDQASPPA